MKTLFLRFKLLFILIGLLAVIITIGDLLPITTQSFFYAISLTIKNILIFFLPLIIFIFMGSSLISLHHQAGKFVILLLFLVSLSNFIAIICSYTVSISILPLVDYNWPLTSLDRQLLPTWELILPQIISTKTTMISSIIFGLFFAFNPNRRLNSIAQKLNKAVIDFFRDFFTPILPLFISGFLLKLNHEKTLSTLVSTYSPILLLIISTQLLYIIVMYLIAADFKFNKCFTYIKNMIPASITAFSTISSTATLPVTIVCTENNLKDKKFAEIIIPATCNIHTLGSAIGITIMALATIKTFGSELPNFTNFMVFAIYWTLAKYAVAGVPGGAIVVAAPLLEFYLGFTPVMVGMITTAYLLFDTFGTAGNVTANGAFAIIFDKIYNIKGTVEN